ncbi:MAG TPA: site-2 protease family protein [Candidatus Deferrimicrobiaceae bacterium]
MPDIQVIIQNISIYALPVILAITFHEVAHGWVASKKGDPTAMMLGRVTLNPLAHIDPIGTVLVPLVLLVMNSGFMFGWAKPVPVNFRLLHDQKRDPIYVASAGVITNLMLASLSGLLFRIIAAIDPGVIYNVSMSGDADTLARKVLVPVAMMLVVSVRINVILAIFNLVPIPPLDGGRIAVGLLPPRASMALASVERYGMPLLILLMMSGIIWRFIDMPIRLLTAVILGAH